MIYVGVDVFQDKTATVGSIIGKLGMAGVWKGLGPRIVMIGTLTALQWFIYDAVKVTLCLCILYCSSHLMFSDETCLVSYIFTGVLKTSGLFIAGNRKAREVPSSILGQGW